MRLPGKLIKEIHERDRNRCVDCGADKLDKTKQPFWIHHIKPKAEGGTDDPANLKLLCFDCTLKYHPKIANLLKKNFRCISSDFLGTYYERCY